jgi:hypothetical protein
MGIMPLPFETLPAPPRRKHLGSFFIALGLVLVILGLAAPAVAFEVLALIDGGAQILAFLLLFFIGVYGGVQLIGWGRRLLAMPAEQLLEKDPRPPVLFMRSFEDDDLLDPTPRMIPLGDMFPRRYEESLARPLKKIGSLISIGRPGNKLSMLGGARMFVSDQNWKEAVEHLRKHSAAVVIMIGRTEGLWWEVESSLKSIPLERLLFFFPFVEQPRRRKSIMQRFFGYRPTQLPLSKRAFLRMEEERQTRFRIFRKRVQSFLKAEIPGDLGSSQFIDFESDGQIRILPTLRPWWRLFTFAMPSASRMIVDLKRTLQPFVSKHRAGVTS